MSATPLPSSPPNRKRKTTTTGAGDARRRRLNSTLSLLIPSISSAVSAAHSFLLTHDLLLLPSHTLSLDSSLSKIQSLLQIQTLKPHSPNVTSSWFERFLLSDGNNSNDARWIETFRMSKPTFCKLCSALSESLSSSLPSISPNFAVGVALYRLAHDGSFSTVGRRFGLTPSDSCRAFYTCCKLICEKKVGSLGGFGSEIAGFERFSLPNCCGVLGLEKFEVNGKVLGGNGFLMVQGLVDSNGRFLNVSAGWPCLFKPGSIFPQTRLFLGVEESKELLNGEPFELSDGDLLPQYILGESCYPLLPWLLTPFQKKGDKSELSLKEEEFNDVHKKAMGLVRMAFGRVRANWKLLNRKWKDECVEFLPFTIITACLLNNFLLDSDAVAEVEPWCVEDHEFSVFEGELRENAGMTRDLLAMQLSWVSQRQ